MRHNFLYMYIFLSFSLHIYHTPHFPHSAFSTLLIFHTPRLLYSAFSTLRVFYTPHFPYSAFFPTLLIFHTPHFLHCSFSTLCIFYTPNFPHSALHVFHQTRNFSFQEVLRCQMAYYGEILAHLKGGHY